MLVSQQDGIELTRMQPELSETSLGFAQAEAAIDQDMRLAIADQGGVALAATAQRGETKRRRGRVSLCHARRPS